MKCVVFCFAVVLGYFGVGDAYSAGSASLRNRCTTVETTIQEDEDIASSDVYALPEGDTVGGALTLKFKLHGDGWLPLVYLYTNKSYLESDYAYRVNLSNDVQSIDKYAKSESGGAGNLAKNITADLVSETESRGFTIGRTTDGSWTVYREDYLFLLAQERQQKLPVVRFFQFFGQNHTWVFNCTGEPATIDNIHDQDSAPPSISLGISLHTVAA